MNTTPDIILLTPTQISQKIKRMAYEIYEHNFQEKEIIFAGITGGGYALAKKLQEAFVQISPIPTTLIEVQLDKFQLVQTAVEINAQTQNQTDYTFIENLLTEKSIILVDDVLNTGRTLAYSLKPFLKIRIKKIEIAVLVNRNYQNFPMKANFIGYSLATTLQEHIKVVLEGEETGVYLTSNLGM